MVIPSPLVLFIEIIYKITFSLEYLYLESADSLKPFDLEQPETPNKYED